MLDRLCHCIKHLPWMSAAQLADICRVPWSQYQEFCGLIQKGVEAGRIEHGTIGSYGVSIPVFRLKDSRL